MEGNKKMCYFDKNCTNLKCTYAHSYSLCHWNDRCKKVDCLYRHSVVICKFQPNCTKKHCKFRHSFQDIRKHTHEKENECCKFN